MYIKINDDGTYGFYTPEVHGEEFCRGECIEIQDDIYDRFFMEQAQGKQFKIKNINGNDFEEIFEEITPITKLTPEQEIAKLKAELEETDYKVIKCYEYQLAGLDMPYDITELHTSRQVIRDKINELTEVQNG